VPGGGPLAHGLRGLPLLRVRLRSRRDGRVGVSGGDRFGCLRPVAPSLFNDPNKESNDGTHHSDPTRLARRRRLACWCTERKGSADRLWPPAAPQPVFVQTEDGLGEINCEQVSARRFVRGDASRR
jgi:hypothetical protein